MEIVNPLESAFIGYSFIFVALAVTMYGLNRLKDMAPGPGLWSVSMALNAVGFALWSRTPYGSMGPWAIVGDLIHMIGFTVLAIGVLCFIGVEFKRRYPALLAGMGLAWLLSMIAFTHYPMIAYFCLLAPRSVIFMVAGIWVLKYRKGETVAGRPTAGTCLILWGVVNMVSPGLPEPPMFRIVKLGLMVGLHTATAMGMLVMIVDRYREQAEIQQTRADRLEGLLPICSSCKKIRNDAGDWEPVESYIHDRSEASFTHGICPECIRKLYPEIADSVIEKMKSRTNGS